MRIPIPIRYKIILPFVALLAFVGVVGTGVATTRLTSAASAQFDANLLHSSLLTNQSLAQLEADRVGQLRAASYTLGVPEAMLAADRASLSRLLQPIAVNAQPANLVIKVLNTSGEKIASVYGSSTEAGESPIADAADFSHLDAVQSVVAGKSDTIGDRYVALVNDELGPMLYWIGPVYTDAGKLTGVMVVGEKLKDIVLRLPGSSLYGLDGRLETSSVPFPVALDSATIRKVTGHNVIPIDATAAGHQTRSLLSQWVMRGAPIGYLAVQANLDNLDALVAQTRLVLTVIFTVAALLTLLLGAVAAALITRPIDSLVRSMRVISTGNFGHRASVKSRDEVGFLATTFNEMAASIEEKSAALEESYFASMEALARAIDARDPSTFGHSARVAAISVQVAQEMGLPAAEIEALRRGALLHDIGKIGVEDRILRKPGPLGPEETRAMQEHPRVGHEMLKGLRFLEASLPGVLHHHERWDGAGYPYGLAGEQIPVAVRILTVADVFDAVTSDRPYRKPMGLEHAYDTIRQEVGIRFDPDVVSAFMRRRDVIARILDEMRQAAAKSVETATLEAA